MKKILLFATSMLLFAACSKDDEGPSLPDPNDVCSAMDDVNFMRFCYDHFDVNKDGKVSKEEAKAVRVIDFEENLSSSERDKIVSIKGIEYFANLEELNCYDCEGLLVADLKANKQLRSICFRACYALTSVTLPNSVTTIEDYAFYDCAALTSVTIPNSVTTIGEGAFNDCEALTSITIPDSVTTIEWGAFYGCSALTSVTIPDSVTKISDCAFSYCSSLSAVYCKPTIPPATGGYIKHGIFKENASNRIIYVPASKDDSIINAYKAADGWKDYADYIVEYEF